MRVDEGVRVEAVVFDLDGTLVDTMRFAPAVYADVVGALGGPQLTSAEVVAVWHIGPTAVLLEHLLRRPVTRSDLDRYYAAFEAASVGIRAFPRIHQMLDELVAAHMPVGICTTATARAAGMMIDAVGLADRFTVIIGGDEAPRPKPAPDGLELACAQLGCLPARAAYVGDARVDLDCAAAAGALGIHATWGLGADQQTRGPLVARTPDDVPRLVGAVGAGAV